MSDLPSWSYTGVVPMQDLSALEAQLHSGRVSAAERGYTTEPEIRTDEVMLTSPPGAEPTYVTAEDFAAADAEFVPTHLRYRMDWPAGG
jgi:hypothetical protein